MFIYKCIPCCFPTIIRPPSIDKNNSYNFFSNLNISNWYLKFEYLFVIFYILILYYYNFVIILSFYHVISSSWPPEDIYNLTFFNKFDIISCLEKFSNKYKVIILEGGDFLFLDITNFIISVRSYQIIF